MKKKKSKTCHRSFKKKRKEKHAAFEDIMVENSLNLVKDTNLQNQEAQQAPNSTN